MMTYLYLAIAIITEVAATTALKSSESFTRLGPSILTAIGYVVASYFLSLTLRTMPIGIAYGLWSGFGIVLISASGWVWFKQTLDAPAIVGLSLIIAGVAVVNVFSKAADH
jgi:small multidrug resistance pump